MDRLIKIIKLKNSIIKISKHNMGRISIFKCNNNMIKIIRFKYIIPNLRFKKVINQLIKSIYQFSKKVK